MSPGFPTLVTPRLILREPRSTDADAFLEIVRDAAVMQYDGTRPLNTRAEALEQLSRFSQLYYSGQGIRWIITLATPDDTTPADHCIGDLGFHSVSRHDRRAEIGYRLSSGYWNQGLMTEAVTALVAYGFRTLRLNRIQAQVDTRNPASQRVLAKVGFRVEGTLREYERERDGYASLVMLALLHNEWQEPSQIKPVDQVHQR